MDSESSTAHIKVSELPVWTLHDPRNRGNARRCSDLRLTERGTKTGVGDGSIVRREGNGLHDAAGVAKDEAKEILRGNVEGAVANPTARESLPPIHTPYGRLGL